MRSLTNCLPDESYFDDIDEDGNECDRSCQTCRGEGWVEGEEFGDPLWYAPDESYTCPNCNGSGDARDQTYW